MLLLNKLPEHKSEYGLFFQNEYAMLRVGYDPEQACRILGEYHGMSANVIRRYIGNKSALRICGDCWAEYVHDYMASVHRCRSCQKEVNLIDRSVIRDLPAGFRRKNDSRYFSERKRIERVVAFLRDEYGLTTAEALRTIGNVQEEERLATKVGLDYGFEE